MADVKLTANGTIRHGVLIESAHSETDPKTGRVRVHPAKTERKVYAPGETFTVPEEEAQALLDAGVARKATKVVDDQPDVQVPVAPNTAPRLPASGATDAPDPTKVAADAKADDRQQSGNQARK